MRPPRSPVSRIDFLDTRILHAIAVNVTAILTAALLVRLATLFVDGSGSAAIPGQIQWVTEPLVWPFKQLPLLSTTVIGAVRLADLVIVPFCFLTGLFIAGIIAGWGQASSPPVHRGSLERSVLD